MNEENEPASHEDDEVVKVPQARVDRTKAPNRQSTRRAEAKAAAKAKATRPSLSLLTKTMAAYIRAMDKLFAVAHEGYADSMDDPQEATKYRVAYEHSRDFLVVRILALRSEMKDLEARLQSQSDMIMRQQKQINDEYMRSSFLQTEVPRGEVSVPPTAPVPDNDDPASNVHDEIAAMPTTVYRVGSPSEDPSDAAKSIGITLGSFKSAEYGMVQLVVSKYPENEAVRVTIETPEEGVLEVLSQDPNELMSKSSFKWDFADVLRHSFYTTAGGRIKSELLREATEAKLIQRVPGTFIYGRQFSVHYELLAEDIVLGKLYAGFSRS